jgi:amidase
MTRTVADAAALLDAMADTETADELGRPVRGRRIGVPRDQWGYSPAADAAGERALSLLSAAGAVIVDGLEMPAVKDLDDEVGTNLMLVELKIGLRKYLATRDVGVRTLADVIAFNRAYAEEELPWFGQSLFEKAQETEGVASPAYLESVDACTAAGLAELDRTLGEHELDALLAPATEPATPIDLVNGDPGGGGGASDSSALAGAPILTVPIELAHGLPVAVALWGARGSEALLLQLGHTLESGRDATIGRLSKPTFAEWV